MVFMDKKLAVVAIIVENPNSVEKVNALLHEYREYVIGRMGLPHRERKVSVISIVIDTTPELINGLSGKLGMIDGVKSKVLTTK